jgi:histidyl-tRNA synthetase
MALKSPAGTEDILPDRIPLWRRVEETTRELFERHGYREIRTPVFEYTGLFVRSVGDTTDIVEKEMYTIPRGSHRSQIPNPHEDEEEDSLTLRPELTASVVRAYLEHGMHKSRPFQKFYYIGPLFRRERPQKGRLRQFHQVGIECLGSRDPLADVETIQLAQRFYEALGITGTRLNLNSTGCRECRGAYREKLGAYFADRRGALCANCVRRLERNVFRVLDCKVAGCQPAIAGAPPVTDHLCPACAEHFGAVRGGLAAVGIESALNPRLVRGLDYYTKTVYEFTSPHLGAQNAIGGGGRYDDLVADLGGPPTGAVGFAIGLERVILAMEGSRKGAACDAEPPAADVFVVAVEDAQRSAAFQLTALLRAEGLRADMGLDARSLKGQMRSADRARARFALILGPEEVSQENVQVKDLYAKTQVVCRRGDVVNHLKSKLSEKTP